jgi:hypothetical protein
VVISGLESVISLLNHSNVQTDLAPRETKPFMTTRHTFLFREGTWKALGYYSDALGNVQHMEGEFHISRLKNRQVAEARINLLGKNASTFVQYFEIPDQDMNEHKSWNSLNLISGQMEGKVMYMNEYIFLMYSSPDGKYSGVENLEKVNDLHYKNHGFAFVNDQKMASWVMDIRRIR